MKHLKIVSAAAATLVLFMANQSTAQVTVNIETSASFTSINSSDVIQKPDNAEIKPSVELSKTQIKFAQILGVEAEELENSELYNFIEKWYGTRYRFGGMSRRGIDCSAYTGFLLRDVYHVSVPRTAREQRRVTMRISKDELQEGDLVFFNTRGRGVTHVGIYLRNGYFTHSGCSKGVSIASLNNSYYKARYLGAGRIQ